jgi:hypothetical protein
VTTEKAILRKEKHLEDDTDDADGDDEVIYKIEVAANRLVGSHVSAADSVLYLAVLATI